MNIQRDSYPQRGADSLVKPQYAMPVIDETTVIRTTPTYTAGTDFTVSAGSAGESLTIKLPTAPIMGTNGRVGYFGNSSLVLGGALATTLATEVAFVRATSTLIGDVTSLSNGQFMVDYETGIIYGKRADTSTTGTATYSLMTRGSSVQGNVESGSTDSGSPIKIGGVYNDVQPTLGNGQRGNIQLNSEGDVNINSKTLIAGENLSLKVMTTVGGFKPTNITASALIKGSSGVFGGWIVNSCSAGATIKFWNNTSAAGTVLHNTVTYTAAVNQGTSATLLQGEEFTTGLYCTITGTMDVTILWV